MKQELIEEISITLLRHGFTLKTLTRSCFNLVARKQDIILLIRAIEDANTLNRESIAEMLRISSTVGASPIIVTEKAGIPLKDNVVYARFSVWTVTPATLLSCLDNNFPILFSTNAGPAAAISGKKLREEREEQGLSLNALARKLGVSNTMIRRYENNDAFVSAKSAAVLNDLFGRKIFKQVEVFMQKKTSNPELSSAVGKRYDKLGFATIETKHAPFDMVSKKEKEIIFTEVGDKKNSQLDPISRMLDSDKLVIFNKKKPKQLPALTKKEFMDFEDAEELIRFIKEFE